MLPGPLQRRRCARASCVLLRYDMFDVVGGLSVFLAMETVFATIPGTQAHQLTGGLVHQFPLRASR